MRADQAGRAPDGATELRVLRDASELQAHQGRDQQEQALRIADADIVQQRLGGHHACAGKKEESRVDEGNHDRNLKEIEKYLRFYPGAPVGFGEEEHHQDGSAVEAIEQAPGGIGQRGLRRTGCRRSGKAVGTSKTTSTTANRNQNRAVMP